MTVVNRSGVNNCDEWKAWESHTNGKFIDGVNYDDSPMPKAVPV
jgi:hypothetical protein